MEIVLMHGSKTVFLPITNPLLATRLQQHLLYKCRRPLELPCSQITQSSSLERQSHPTFLPKHWHVYTGTTNQKDSRNPLPPSPQNVKPVKEQSIYRLRCSISWSDMVTGLQHKQQTKYESCQVHQQKSFCTGHVSSYSTLQGKRHKLHDMKTW